MAKNVAEEKAPGGGGTNNPSLSIKATFAQMYDLDKQIADAIAKHVQPLKDERKGIVSNLKDTTGIERKDINLNFKLFARAKSTLEMDEDDHGDQVRDNLRVLFDALYPDGQLDFMKAFDAAEAAKKEVVAAAKKAAVH